MIMVFFPVENSFNYSRHTFDGATDDKDTLRKLLRIGEGSLHIYDFNANAEILRFQENFNDELVEGGWWCIALDVTDKELLEIRTKTIQEQSIRDMLLDMSDGALTQFMREMGIWNKKEVLEYTPDNVSCLIQKFNDSGYDIRFDLSIGHDYHICANEPDETNCVHINGLPDETDAFEELLKMDELIPMINGSDGWYNRLCEIYKSDK